MLTFNEVPEALAAILQRQTDIENLLQKILSSQTPQQHQDELLTVQEAATFLTLSVPTIYGLISKGTIPYMKQSKRVYFSRKELINYLKTGRRKTQSEIESETDAYLAKKKGGKAL